MTDPGPAAPAPAADGPATRQPATRQPAARQPATRTAVRRAIRFAAATDAYKLGHHLQYPAGTQTVYSNLTARKSRLDGIDRAVFFGLQAFLQEWCVDAFEDFVACDEELAIDSYADLIAPFLGGNPPRVEHMRALHRLGYLPLEFRALEEGTSVPIGVPMLTVENTHPDFYWLTNYIETVMSASLWHPIVSASKAARMRAMLDRYATETAGATDAVDFQGHDFSYRGMSGTESAAASGAGHLLSFAGSDCVPAAAWIEDLYGSERGSDNGLVAASVPATEHSVMCAGGQIGERETFERLLDLYPTGILSVVSDTWDLWSVLDTILPQLAERITARNGTLVVRPDSGNPVDIICGDPAAPSDMPAAAGVIRLLWDRFGGTVNGQGFKVLDPHVGAIYGDGITYERAEAICQRLRDGGFASTNVVFGVGSYTYQPETRDSLGMAVKATWAQVDGVGRDLFKDPVTDSGEKRSAKGRLAVLPDEGQALRLVQQATPDEEARSLLRPVWRDGRFLRTQSFADVRATLRSTRTGV